LQQQQQQQPDRQLQQPRPTRQQSPPAAPPDASGVLSRLSDRGAAPGASRKRTPELLREAAVQLQAAPRAADAARAQPGAAAGKAGGAAAQQQPLPPAAEAAAGTAASGLAPRPADSDSVIVIDDSSGSPSPEPEAGRQPPGRRWAGRGGRSVKSGSGAPELMFAGSPGAQLRHVRAPPLASARCSATPCAQALVP
jgi:hypothetical protein